MQIHDQVFHAEFLKKLKGIKTNNCELKDQKFKSKNEKIRTSLTECFHVSVNKLQ
jgi:hypothetical protein